MAISDLKGIIDATIKTNGRQEITGASLNGVLTQMVDATDAEITELSAEVEKKQNTITDLETIRSGAAKGATALQSVPATYATKTDVSNAIQSAITNELNADF